MPASHCCPIPIYGNKLTLSQLPIGAYKLQRPTGKSTKYYLDNHYAIVKNGSDTISVDVTSSSPHSYFVNQAYAKIEIYNLAGNIVFNRTINGDKTTASHDVIAFEPYYRINIFHAEVTNRLKLSPYTAGVVNTKSSNNSFTVTPA